MRARFIILLLAMGLATASCDLFSLTQPPRIQVEDRTDARDAAIAYVNKHYQVEQLSADLDWQEERLTPPGLIGSERWQFTAAGWEVTICWPVVLHPDYAVTIRTSAHGWVLWDGIVHPTGVVEELGWVDARPPNAVTFDRASARDAAIAYVQATDPSSGIPLDASWQEEETTPEGIVGSASYRYTFADWHIDVSHPIVPIPNYRVEVVNSVSRFYWQGTVRATGVAEPIPPIALEGNVLVVSRYQICESWGIHVEEGPEEYLGQDVGLGSHAAMKDELAPYEGQRIRAVVPKICRSGDEGCCASVFELCTPFVLSWAPVLNSAPGLASSRVQKGGY